MMKGERGKEKGKKKEGEGKKRREGCLTGL